MTSPHAPHYDHLVARLHTLSGIATAKKETKDAVKVALDDHKEVLKQIDAAGGTVTPALRDEVCNMGESMTALLRTVDLDNADVSTAANAAWNAFGRVVVVTTGGMG